MLPLALALRESGSDLSCRIVLTAQHRDMLDQVMNVFGLSSDIDLDIMRPGQTLTEITTRGLQALTDVYTTSQPDLVLVHGDTTTTLAATLAAFYQQIPVGHVEAGLRSGDKMNPWPEEVNRVVADAICDLHFAPTNSSRDNLLNEGVDQSSIFVTGNTGIDGLKLAVDKFSRTQTESSGEIVDAINALVDQKFVLVTAHRRENFGQPIENLCQAILRMVEEHPDLQFVYPVHPNPAILEPVNKLLGPSPRVKLLPPLDYGDFVTLMNASWFVLTDSGGVQEEAPALGKPVLVFRQVTERPEAVAAGTVKIAGTQADKLFADMHELATNAELFAEMQRAVNPYGDGHASARTVAAIRYFFGASADRPDDFNPN